MPGINIVILEGDIAVLQFPLTTPESFTKGGIKMEQTGWHPIMFRGMAGHAAKVRKKGKLSYLDGKLSTYSLENKAGIIAEKFGVRSKAEPADHAG